MDETPDPPLHLAADVATLMLALNMARAQGEAGNDNQRV
jgi:hypothetical protein